MLDMHVVMICLLLFKTVCEIGRLGFILAIEITNLDSGTVKSTVSNVQKPFFFKLTNKTIAMQQRWALSYSVVTYFLRPWIHPARSLVMIPLSTVSTQTFSRVWQNLIRSLLPSNLPRCSRPRVQAKIEAIGLVLVGLP